MAENEYIDREAFRRQLINRQITDQYFNARERHEIGCIIEMLDKAPTADVAPVVHGEWKEPYDGFHDMIVIICSRCLYRGAKHFKYCPNCGAKMDGGL